MRSVEARYTGPDTIIIDDQRWHRIATLKGRLISLLGPVEYMRSMYRRRGEGSYCPVDESLGLLAGLMTRPTGKLVTSMRSHCTPREIKAILDRAGFMSPSVSTIQRLMEGVHGTWRGIEEEALVAIHSGEDIPAKARSVSVQPDGVKILMRAEKEAGGDEVTCDGGSGSGGCWKEASCRAVSFHDEKGVSLPPSVTAGCPSPT